MRPVAAAAASTWSSDHVVRDAEVDAERRGPRRSPGRARAATTAAGPRPRLAQLDGLGQLGDPQPGGAAAQGGARTGHQAVAVGVGLDDGHHLGAAGPRLERGDVAADGDEVDLGTRGQPRRRRGWGGAGRGGAHRRPVFHERCSSASEQVGHGLGMPCATASARTGPPGLARSAATPCTRAPRLPASSGLEPGGEQGPADAGQHVAGPCRGQPGRGVVLRAHRTAVLGRGDDEGGRTLEQDGGAGAVGGSRSRVPTGSRLRRCAGDLVAGRAGSAAGPAHRRGA